MKLTDIDQHNIADEAIRLACSEIYLAIKHDKRDGKICDQTYQLIIAKLSQIESALIEPTE